MKKVVFALEPLHCASCIKKIESTLNSAKGVKEAKVLFHSNKVKAQFDEDVINSQEIEDIITQLGYPVVFHKVSS